MSYFTLTLDTAPPASPTLVLNGGAPLTADQVVQATLDSGDYGGGAQDVTEMKLWGDVDSTADFLVNAVEGLSSWQPFNPDAAVKLSAGNGRKTVYARLRDDVLNETVAFSDFIDLDTTSPATQITTPVDRGRISKTAPADNATFSWQSTHAFTHYEVRVVPSIGSPHTAGVLIGSIGGSVNTTGDGAFPALTPIATTITGTDLEAASPGNAGKIVKVFVLDTGGIWSP